MGSKCQSGLTKDGKETVTCGVEKGREQFRVDLALALNPK